MTEDRTTPRRRRWPLVVCLLAVVLFAMVYLFFRDDALGDHSDLAVPPITEENMGSEAYDAWLVAAGKIDPTPYKEAVRKTARLVFEQLDGTKPWDQAPFQRIIDANHEAYEAALHADSLGPFRQPAVYRFDQVMPHLGEFQSLSKTLRVISTERLVAGDIEAATRAAMVNLRFSDHLLDQPNTVISFLVAVTCQAITYASIDRLLTKETPDEILLQIDAALAEEPDVLAGVEHSIRAEFAIFSDGILRKDELVSGPGGGLFSGHNPPIFLLKEHRTINLAALHYREALANCRRVPQQRQELPQVAAPGWSSNAFGNWMLSDGLGVTGKVVEKADRSLAHRRALRTKIALLRHHRAEGELPATLAELVPSYIDAVPTDPHASAPFRYDPARGAIWSIGGDLTDSGGAVAPGGTSFGHKDADPTMFVFPPPPPASAAP